MTLPAEEIICRACSHIRYNTSSGNHSTCPNNCGKLKPPLEHFHLIVAGMLIRQAENGEFGTEVPHVSKRERVRHLPFGDPET